MRRLSVLLLVVLTAGCAGMQKDCAKTSADSFGADWIVVQYAQDGRPFHCWKLRQTVVSSSEGGNVDWQDRTNGHLVHLTGWENRVQVVNGDFDGAAQIVGVTAADCGNGVYHGQR